MTTPKTFIIGYDFSAQARHALQMGLRLADAAHDRVIVVTSLQGHLDRDVLHAIQHDAEASHARTDLYASERLIQAGEQRLRAELDGFHLGDTQVRVEVGLGRPWELILEAADNYEADLIVVGVTGLGTLERWVVGSTSERLVRQSRWPVMVVAGEQAPRTILCPVDFSPASSAALAEAVELGRRFDSLLHIVHAVPSAPSFAEVGAFDDDSWKEAAGKQAAAQLDAFLAEQDLTGVQWERHLRLARSGEVAALPDALIVASAAELKVDLICMGSIGRSGLQAVLIGNTAERVLRNLPCSLLTVKSDDFSLKRA